MVGLLNAVRQKVNNVFAPRQAKQAFADWDEFCSYAHDEIQTFAEYAQGNQISDMIVWIQKLFQTLNNCTINGHSFNINAPNFPASEKEVLAPFLRGEQKTSAEWYQHVASYIGASLPDVDKAAGVLAEIVDVLADKWQLKTISNFKNDLTYLINSFNAAETKQAKDEAVSRKPKQSTSKNNAIKWHTIQEVLRSCLGDLEAIETLIAFCSGTLTIDMDASQAVRNKENREQESKRETIETFLESPSYLYDVIQSFIKNSQAICAWHADTNHPVKLSTETNVPHWMQELTQALKTTISWRRYEPISLLTPDDLRNVVKTLASKSIQRG